MIEFMAITNDASTASRWHAAGVQRIMVDLEKYGKAERQKHRDTVKSDHAVDDIGVLRRAVPTAHVVARCEPRTMPGWSGHIREVLRQHPTSVMMPMVESVADVQALDAAVDGRADLIVMIETAASLAAVDELVLAVPEATFFVGLNDLHMQLEQRFMFEPVADGHVERVAQAVGRHGTAFGFGGLARTGRGTVDSAAIVKEHVRLGSSLAILSRSFFVGLDDPLDIDEIRREIAKLRAVENAARLRTAAECENDFVATQHLIRVAAADMTGTGASPANPPRVGR